MVIKKITALVLAAAVLWTSIQTVKELACAHGNLLVG